MPSTTPRPEAVGARAATLRSAALTLAAALALSACVGSQLAGGTGGRQDAYRTVGTLVDDEGIEIRTYDAIHRNDGPARGRGNYVRVTSFNRVVLLAGEVSSEERRKQIVEIARRVSNVRRVVDELAVTDVRSLGRRMRDTLLTAQVNTALLSVDIPGFAPQRVKVVSVRGNVYLMGLLTADQADRVAEKVAAVPGVASVVKVFDYIDQPAEG